MNPLAKLSLRGAIGAFAILGFAIGANAQAPASQVQTAAAAPAQQVRAAKAPSGRTRAEVIAELQCARASGELEAAVLSTYGLIVAPRPTGEPCETRGTFAAAGDAAAPAGR